MSLARSLSVALAVLVSSELVAGPLDPPGTSPAPAAKGSLIAAEQAQLGRAFRALLREPDARKRASGLAKQDAVLKKAAFVDIEAAIAAAVPGEQWNPGFSHGVKFTSHGDAFVYSVHLPDRRPKQLAPLVVDAGHISLADNSDSDLEDVMSTWMNNTDTGQSVIYLRPRVFDRLSTDGRYEPWSAMQRPQGKENMDTLAAILLDAIDDACMRYPVDPNRVYIHGISMSGFWAWYAGAFAPDRFAAVVPVSSVTWHVLPLLESFRDTRVFVLHGENDTTIPITAARAAVDKLQRLEIAVDFRAVAGGEHVKGTFAQWGALWPDVAGVVRDPYPKRVSHAFHGDERAAAFWLEAIDVPARAFDARQAPCRMSGVVEGQTIKIDAAGMKKVRVLLASRLLDLAQPITIDVNGRRQFAGTVKPDAALAIEVARARGDGAQAYSAGVTVSVP